MCTTLAQCRQSTCNPTTGQCVESATADGSDCVNENTCTQNDICEGGVCVDGNPVANGTACEDGQGCSLSSSCQGGACASEIPTCRDEARQNDKSFCDLTTGQCVTDTDCPPFFTDPEGNENKCALLNGVDPDTGLCLYRDKICAPQGCENEECNPSTGACEIVATPTCTRDGCRNGLGGGNDPCPVSSCVKLHCSAVSVSPVNCNSVTIVRCDEDNPSTCQVTHCEEPQCLGGCREDGGCQYASVACDPSSDPCTELVMDGTSPGCCTYVPKDCAGQFGNDPNYIYCCEVVGAEGVCRATPN